ncbi:MAG: glycoside hydrolase family 99-like domain-containing protein [Haloarculaceae archaeon]
MDGVPRRAFLRALGLTGAVGLSGCQGLSSEEKTNTTKSIPSTTDQAKPVTPTGRPTTATPTTTTRFGTTVTDDETVTPTATPAATIRFDTTVAEGDTAMHLRVSGRVTAARGVAAVEVSAGEKTARFDAGGAGAYTLDADLSVTGGRSYQVTVTVTDADSNEFAEHRETDHVPIFIDPIETNRLVGAHYYPWYEMNPGHENWTERTVSTPVLGEYASDDRSVVDQHIKWSVEHGVRWWSVSWWGPNSDSDRALRGTLSNAEQFEHLSFSILYETKGRLEEFNYDLDRQEARDRLANDLTYIADNYFARDNYRRVDGRPVVFFYIAQTLQGDVAGAFAEATADLETDLYVLADLPFGDPPISYPVIDVADAVTSYSAYSPRPDIEQVFHDNYEQGLKVLHLGAETADLDYVPVLIPGFNDTGLPASIREDNPVLSASPDRYEQVCEQVRPHLEAAESVLVTSFNEWYENTQIEPDEEYGTAYLKLTRDRLATISSPGFEPTGKRLRLVFDETIVPARVNPDSNDHRELAFMTGRLEFRDGEETIVSFDVGSAEDELLYLAGAYGPSSDGSRTWRWFGGPDAETILFVEADLSGADTAVLTGQPMRTDRIEADVYFGGNKTDHVAFRERDGEFDDYELSLSGS